MRSLSRRPLEVSERWSSRLLLAATLVLLVAVAGSLATVRQRLSTQHVRELRMQHLTGQIRHLDEVLTMSARMAAATGDLKWERRYREHEPVLDAAIKELIAISPTAYETDAGRRTDDANRRLVVMENRGLELIRGGDRAGAEQILFAGEYERQKARYAQGMQACEDRLRAAVTADARLLTLRLWALLAVSVIAAAVLAIGWLRMGRAKAALREQIARQTVDAAHAQALATANDALLRAAAERENLHGQLLASSRQAGMAEVATGVLHNVGNVLNSLNVSANVVADKLRNSEVASLAKAGDMLRQHQDNLAQFLSVDERGKHLPRFLIQVADCLSAEQASLLQELDAVTRGIDHVKHVVSMQQAHAGKPSFLDTVRPADLMEAAIEIQLDSLTREGIAVDHRFEDLPAQATDKHRVIEILVNLIANARQAMADAPVKRLTVTVSARCEDGRRGICFKVQDTGKGIPPENLTRIFSSGFTTRHDGHGFGLHSAANAAQAMGGTLTPFSDGLGTGAAFRLILPALPAEPTRAPAEPIASGSLIR
jgi:signal transduction histidine kinase